MLTLLAAAFKETHLIYQHISLDFCGDYGSVCAIV
jgi:hypothetical protein